MRGKGNGGRRGRRREGGLAASPPSLFFSISLSVPLWTLVLKTDDGGGALLHNLMLRVLSRSESL
jgi:hypothetical protein